MDENPYKSPEGEGEKGKADRPSPWPAAWKGARAGARLGALTAITFSLGLIAIVVYFDGPGGLSDIGVWGVCAVISASVMASFPGLGALFSIIAMAIKTQR